MSFKTWFKNISKTDGFRSFACRLGAFYIRLVYKTGSWQVINGETPHAYWDEGKPFILAFWHGRILMMPYCWAPDKQIEMLISQHRDGLLIANTVQHFGIKTIAGSTSKGGAAALRTMLKTLKRGDYIGITPDGPRGPRMHASNGIVNVAKLSGVPVIACAFGSTRRKHARSWDRFLIALPFSKGHFVWGDAIHVARDADDQALESARLAIEAELNRITALADQLSNHPAIQPAELETKAGGA